MYKTAPSTPRGRGRGIPPPRTPPKNNWNHSSRQQKSRLDAALTAQWSKDQDQERSGLTEDCRKTNVDRRDREGIISGIPTTSKSQRTNYYEAELQNARSMLRPTASTETRSNRTGNVHSYYSPNTSMDLMDDTQEDADMNQPMDVSVTIATKVEGESFGKISAITVSRALKDLVSTYNFKVLSTTTIRVSTKETFLTNLLDITLFCGKEVEVALCTNKGPREYSWGKFFSSDLFYSSDQEILEQLKEENENISFVKRLFRGSDKTATRLIKVKFETPRRPDYVYCLGRVYEILEYLPPVKRCLKCFSYMHYTSNCKPNIRKKCNNCSLEHPETEDCTNETRCFHCGLGHTSDDPNCPKYMKEKEVIAISLEQNIPYEKARNKVNHGEISYASTLKRKSETTIPNSRNMEQITERTTSTGTTLIFETRDACTGRENIDTNMEIDIKETLEKADDDQLETDRVLYGPNTNKLPAWMVIVVELTKALASATDLNNFRTSFSTIIRDIENELDLNKNTPETQLSSLV